MIFIVFNLKMFLKMIMHGKNDEEYCINIIPEIKPMNWNEAVKEVIDEFKESWLEQLKNMNTTPKFDCFTGKIIK